FCRRPTRQARLYAAMPGQSGTVMTLGNVTGFFGKLLSFGIGLAAETFGLGAAMWLLLAGPIALLIGLPFHREAATPEERGRESAK
ncbi:MAG: hypothetical protein Q7U34_00930, partial [Anaerolineales bacterium]|nr:hypothetical protein [Anaerolineales bacterium]